MSRSFAKENFEVKVNKRMSEFEARERILEILDGIEPNELCALDKQKRNEKLNQMCESGISIRQIERATGISRGVIFRCTKA